MVVVAAVVVVVGGVVVFVVLGLHDATSMVVVDLESV